MIGPKTFFSKPFIWYDDNGKGIWVEGDTYSRAHANEYIRDKEAIATDFNKMVLFQRKVELLERCEADKHHVGKRCSDMYRLWNR